MRKKYYLILILITICLLGISAFWRFESFRQLLSQPDFSGLELSELEIPLLHEEKSQPKSIILDEKLEIKYSSAWIETEESSLEQLSLQIAKEGGEILFFGQKLNLKEGSFASLVVEKLLGEKEIKPEGWAEKIKREAEEKKIDLEILDLRKEGGKIFLEGSYKKEGMISLHTRQMVVFSGQTAYLIIFLAPENNWLTFQMEAEEILNSAWLID